MDELIERIQPYVETAWAWAQTPAAWGQIAAIAVVLVLAGLFTRLLRPRLRSWLTPAEGDKGLRATARRQILRLMPLLWPLLAAALALLAESILTSIFGTAGIVGFLKRLFLFLAVRAYVRDVLKDPFLRAFGRFLVLPIALVYVVGLLPAASAALANVKVPLGNLSFSLLWAIKFGLFGGLIFWLGRWSNERSQSYLENQEELRPATRILAIKASEIAIFGAAFLILMNVMGVDLTTLAVLGGALGVGIGLGLQQIASNFISGIILLLEGQATVGDYVELDGGEQGTIVKMTMRSIILETFDGKWIVVPNEHFITTRVVNYSDQGSANRLEAPFSVSYETDINRVPEIVEAAVSTHPAVLSEPQAPDCELRGFGESGIDFAVEFWVSGLDDGPNKYTSDVLFLIWNALKAEGIEIPYPRRVIEMRTPGIAPTLEA
ncbi:mechanosensitive ion channel protein MscS [Thioclava sp. L04-15]|uniref:mechanosensitive ion channel family protein n=1 Tax=Thioclava sp. L04-15 TaxID=1915318 RepID=UPI0009967D73|nr:mechanosensitive ion channel domain-containing protein [Thioclava sp. L04-15]OOY28656.1 mechanosensitive ion channel protein MscS [Thioclava sp. L04-15]